MSSAMYQKLIYLFLIIFLTISCAKDKEVELNIPPDQEQSFEIYKEAVKEMNSGNYLVAATQFSEAEAILPKIEFSAKASLMSSYCLYVINFYSEANKNLERFLVKYPTDKNIVFPPILSIEFRLRIVNLC